MFPRSDPSRQLVNGLAVEIHPNPDALGTAAARAVLQVLQNAIDTRSEARVIFACAPSQNSFFAQLCRLSAQSPRFPWERVDAFHMDEYVGLSADHPQSFRRYLHAHLLEHVTVRRFQGLSGEAADLSAECIAYAAQLAEKPIDLICLGIGENGHIAFNDPGVADFDDPWMVKPVQLDPECRQQQVNDGCFSSLADVPTHALTLTIPVFRHAARLSIHVPGSRKARAVRAALRDPISPRCPASILRLHPCATLHLDAESAALL
jgi:glucosamine-6-phosphate deaminase